MSIPEKMIKRAACVIAGNVTESQWDANPDCQAEHWDYAEKALEAAGVGELITALEQIKRTIGKARNHASAAIVAYDTASAILAKVGAAP